MEETTTTVTTALQDAFSAGLNTIQSDVNGYMVLALPVALSIAGTFMAIRLGINFFKSIAN